MAETDSDESSRLVSLTALMEVVGSVDDPAKLLDTFVRGMGAVYGMRDLVFLSTVGLAKGEYRILRLQTHDGTEHLPSVDPWAKPNLPIERGGVLASLIASGLPGMTKFEQPAATDRFPAVLHRNRVAMAAPVTAAPAPISWIILFATDASAFEPGEIEDFVINVNLIGLAVNTLNIARDLTLANQRIARDIKQIARIQRSLLPDALPRVPGLQVAVSYEPSELAGGDIYDFHALGPAPGNNGAQDDRWAFLIADASGHGPAAAVVMAIVHSIVHSFTGNPTGPAEVLAHINRQLCQTRIDYSFVTAFLAFYGPATRRLTYCRAGQNPPLLACPSGQFTYLDGAAGIPLGIESDAVFTEEAVTLNTGQILIAYTDGVTDASVPHGPMFGTEGIERALRPFPAHASTAVEQIVAAIKAHQCGAQPTDDQTLLVLEVTDQEALAERTSVAK